MAVQEIGQELQPTDRFRQALAETGESILRRITPLAETHHIALGRLTIVAKEGFNQPNLVTYTGKITIPQGLSTCSLTWNKTANTLTRYEFEIGEGLKGKGLGPQITLNDMIALARKLGATKFIVQQFMNQGWKEKLVRQYGFHEDPTNDDRIYLDLE